MRKVVFIIILATLVVSIYFFGINNKQQLATKLVSESRIVKQLKSLSSDKQEEHSSVVSEVFSLAKEGKIPGYSFIAGQTEINEIIEQWGDSETPVSTSNGIYIDYNDREATVGYQDDIIIDLRSSAPNIQQITLQSIKQEQGEPDEIRYYKDDNHNQIILVYNVTSTHVLKWILPYPTDENPNPSVHHISVYAKAHNKQQTVNGIMAQMSLDEKIGQMILAGITGTKSNKSTASLINDYKVGGIIFYEDSLISPQQAVQLLNQVKNDNRDNRLPLFLSVDQEGGRISKLPGLSDLPTNREIGQVADESLSFEIGKLLGQQLKAFGLNVNYAPVLDVNSNPDNPVIGDRSFGSNPEIVTKLGIETMKGIQSEGIIPVVKHFPGHGDTATDSHLELPKVDKSLTQLNQLELVPFREAIEQGADMVMIAHILYPELDESYPASMSELFIKSILRENMNYSGVVITDDLTMQAITKNFDITDAAIQSIKAGSDIIMVAHDYKKVVSVANAIKESVQSGVIKEERIDKSVQRIIELKLKYNLNHEPVKETELDQLNKHIESMRRYTD